MIKHICDVCKRNEASQRYEIREQQKRTPPGWWSKWKEIEICEECAEWLLAVKMKEVK